MRDDKGMRFFSDILNFRGGAANLLMGLAAVALPLAEINVHASDDLFGEQRIITLLADGVRSVQVADIDGDLDIDVISASFYSDEVACSRRLEELFFAPE